MRYLYCLLSIFLLCSCATSPTAVQQRMVPVIVEEGNFSYSLLCEKKSHPGKFFLLPILEKQVVDENISRLYFRVGIKKDTAENLIVKAFLKMQNFDGDKVVGTISGLEKTSVIVEIDLPVEDILTQYQAIVAWFTVENKYGGLIFQSKKIKIGGESSKK